MTAAADRLDEAMGKGRSRAWPELLIRFRAAEAALREIADIQTGPARLGSDRLDGIAALERCRRIALRTLARLDEDV